jgi:hypothetical protein
MGEKAAIPLSRQAPDWGVVEDRRNKVKAGWNEGGA